MNEIIILNFLGHNENTYSNISKRGFLDSNLLEELVPNKENDDMEDMTKGEQTINELTSNE